VSILNRLATQLSDIRWGFEIASEIFRKTAGQTRQQAFFLKQAPNIVVGYLSVLLNTPAFGQSPFQSPQRMPFGFDEVSSPAPCDKESEMTSFPYLSSSQSLNY
jgi:hypothetical protein